MSWHPKTRWDPNANECWMADFKHLQFEALQKSSLDRLTERARNYLAIVHEYRDRVVMVSAFAGMGILAAFPDNRQPVGPSSSEPVYHQETGREHRPSAAEPGATDSPSAAGRRSPPRRNPGMSCG